MLSAPTSARQSSASLRTGVSFLSLFLSFSFNWLKKQSSVGTPRPAEPAGVRCHTMLCHAMLCHAVPALASFLPQPPGVGVQGEGPRVHPILPAQAVGFTWGTESLRDVTPPPSLSLEKELTWSA